MLGLTGATGYLGRALLAALQKADCPVTTLGRRAASDEVMHRPLSLDGGGRFREALEGIDTLVHLAGVAHHGGDQSAYEQVNIRASQALADAAIHAGCRRLVFVSSLNVVPEGAARADTAAERLPCPTDAYSRSKWEAERKLEALCAGCDIELTLVRPALVYDDELVASLAQLRNLLQRWPLRLPQTGRRSLVSRQDLVSLLSELAVAPEVTAGVRRIPVSEGGCYDLARIGRGLCTRRRGWLPVPLWSMALAATIRDRLQGLPSGATWEGLAGRKWCAPEPQPQGFKPRQRFGSST